MGGEETLMDSIGSGEILVVAIVALLAIDPKTAGRWWRRLRELRGRVQEARELLQREIGASMEPVETPQQRLRQWARRRVEELGQTDFEQAPARMLALLRGWDGYRDAADVAAFWSIRSEVPTRALLDGILADGKRLWLPRVAAGPGAMDMVPVSDPERDLRPGRWGLREPMGDPPSVPESILVLVPGEVFDLHGARIGKGGGYYDRWLAAHPASIAVGTAWDRQIHPGRLPQSSTDRRVSYLLTPERFVNFALENDRTGRGWGPEATSEETNA